MKMYDMLVAAGQMYFAANGVGLFEAGIQAVVSLHEVGIYPHNPEPGTLVMADIEITMEVPQREALKEEATEPDTMIAIKVTLRDLMNGYADLPTGATRKVRRINLTGWITEDVRVNLFKAITGRKDGILEKSIDLLKTVCGEENYERFKKRLSIRCIGGTSGDMYDFGPGAHGTVYRLSPSGKRVLGAQCLQCRDSNSLPAADRVVALYLWLTTNERSAIDAIPSYMPGDHTTILSGRAHSGYPNIT